MDIKSLSPIALFTALIVVGNVAAAAQFYRWVDENGSTFIEGNIPPEYVAGGYDIIDDYGNLIKSVAPEMSKEERDANKNAKLNAEMQRARDEELLKIYRSPSDVDRAMKTWLSRMDMEIRVKMNRIRIKESEFDGLQEHAASLEKTGREIDPETILKMDSIKLEIDQFKLEIAEVKKRQEEAGALFMLDRDRMVVLWEMINKKPWVEPEKKE